MNTKMKILGIALVAVLAVAAVGASVAFAQTPAPGTGAGQTGYGPGMMGGRSGMGGRGMMGGNGQTGGVPTDMTAMHEWMTASGGMHTFVWEALAEKLGLTSDELTAEVNSGKTVAQVAEEQGVSRADLVAALETAHTDGLAQAVADGSLTQEQADSMLARMAGRYETMIDTMGANGQAGRGMMGGNGQAGGRGMMGGRGGAGGCRGNWNTDATTQPAP